MIRRLWIGLAVLLIAAPAGFMSAPAGLEAAELLSHRAIYRMSLDRATGGSEEVAAEGMMLYRFAEACDGWTVENRTYLRLRYERGSDTETVWTFVSWEAADGFHQISEKLHAYRKGLPRYKQIQNASPHRIFSGVLHQGSPGVSGGFKAAHQCIPVGFFIGHDQF